MISPKEVPQSDFGKVYTLMVGLLWIMFTSVGAVAISTTTSLGPMASHAIAFVAVPLGVVVGGVFMFAVGYLGLYILYGIELAHDRLTDTEVSE